MMTEEHTNTQCLGLVNHLISWLFHGEFGHHIDSVFPNCPHGISFSFLYHFTHFRVIHGVGKGTDLSPQTLPKYAMSYLPSCKAFFKKLNQPFTNVNFIKCAMKMFLQHVIRSISTGCDVTDRYIATPANFENKVAIIDGKKQKLVGMVTLVSGVPKKKTDLLWVPL